MLMKTPLDRWTAVLELLSTARKADHDMKHAPRSDDRDEATMLYCNTVDAMVTELATMQETGALEHVSDALEIITGRAS